MDTPPPPLQTAITNRYIPAEILEEILLNLPVKSLLRFSSASKSWNCMIHEARFVKKYCGPKRIIIDNPFPGEFLSCPLSAVLSTSHRRDKPLGIWKTLWKTFFSIMETIFEFLNCPLPSAVLSNSNNPIEIETEIEEATSNHVFPLYPSDEILRIIDVCNGLWFVESRKNKLIIVWNPSMRTYRKLSWQMGSSVLCYGLGYDSVGDDYKLLKICNDNKVILYSLRNNSWRRIQSHTLIKRYPSSWSCFVNGALHWLCRTMNYDYVIVSFDLSKEEYGESALPPEHSPTHEYVFGDLTVLRGKLCLSLNYRKKCRFVLWVMEGYGVVESWTKKFDFDLSLELRDGFRPLYICDNWLNAVFVLRYKGECWVVNKDGKTLLRKNFGRRKIYGRGFVYVESLVSPAMYLPRHRNTLLDDAHEIRR